MSATVKKPGEPRIGPPTTIKSKLPEGRKEQDHRRGGKSVVRVFDTVGVARVAYILAKTVRVYAPRATGWVADIKSNVCATRRISLRRVLTLLDISRAYAEAYVKGGKVLAALNVQIFYAARERDYDVRNDHQLLTRLETHLSDLLEHCQPHLLMTAAAALKLKATINNPDLMSTWQDANIILQNAISEVISRLEGELALNVFFRLPEARRSYFEAPTDGWKDVIARFPDTISNIEEMNKCFALSRYAATIYHACQVIELGVIQLGAFLGVTDPKSGFTAVSKELKKLIDKGHANLPPRYENCFDFLEQMHGLTEALKSAWRNKIDHAQKTLVLTTVDFTPDIAEEILFASRAFMRRLATELPSNSAAFDRQPIQSL